MYFKLLVFGMKSFLAEQWSMWFQPRFTHQVVSRFLNSLSCTSCSIDCWYWVKPQFYLPSSLFLQSIEFFIFEIFCRENFFGSFDFLNGLNSEVFDPKSMNIEFLQEIPTRNPLEIFEFCKFLTFAFIHAFPRLMW